MVIIRPTGDLAKRMKEKLKASEKKSSTTLGDWYALDLVIKRQQFILCVSENGRLPVILRAAPYADFTNRLPAATGALLNSIGVPKEKVLAEISQMDEVVIAKTINRSVLGSMNEFRLSLQTSSRLGRLENDALQMSVWLAELISLILPENTPKDSVLKLFGEPTSKTSRPAVLKVVQNPSDDCC